MSLKHTGIKAMQLYNAFEPQDVVGVLLHLFVNSCVVPSRIFPLKTLGSIFIIRLGTHSHQRHQTGALLKLSPDLQEGFVIV